MEEKNTENFPDLENLTPKRRFPLIMVATFIFVVLGGILGTSYAAGINEQEEIPVYLIENTTVENTTVCTEPVDLAESIQSTEPSTAATEPKIVHELSKVTTEAENTEPESVFKYDLILLSEIQTAEEENKKESDSPVVMEARIGSRYCGLTLTQDDVDLLVDVIWLEARGEPLAGQQAVAEVAFNRVVNKDYFPDDLYDVIYDVDIAVQFPTAHLIGMAKPTEEQRKNIIKCIEQALNGPHAVPSGVVFFAVEPENENIWGNIGKHVFCYPWSWCNN